MAKALVAAQEAVKTLKEMKEKDGKKNGEGFAAASKVVKSPEVFRSPEVFEPRNMEEELSQWQDWRLAFKSWITFAEEAYNKELDTIEGSETEVKLTTEGKGRAEKLYAILVGLLRNRPLKLLRAAEGRDGYEVWRQLSLQLAPKTRSRSIALLQAFLNHPNFTKDKGMTTLEQLLGLERLAERQGGQRGHQRQRQAECLVEGDASCSPTASTAADDRGHMLAYERTTTSWGRNWPSPKTTTRTTR